MNAVPGGPYWHFFYYGLLRAWVAPVVIWLDWKYTNFGRKALLLSSLSVSGKSHCYLTSWAESKRRSWDENESAQE